jgi:hypothetical protein
MKWRWIATAICMLYLSVGFVASAHDHSGHALSHKQCDACAWHHHNQVDVPVTTDRVAAPERIFVAQEAPSITVFRAAIGFHESRGPPSIPQL